MPYFPDLADPMRDLQEWIDLKHEQGADVAPLVENLKKMVAALTEEAIGLEVDPELARFEPDGLESIKALRPQAEHVLALELSEEELEDRIMGAWMGRAAGNMLGVPCEGFSREKIRSACAALSEPYPLTDYWSRNPRVGDELSTYNGLPFRRFFKPHLQYVMPDDDLLYTTLGLVILERYGKDFTPQQVGEAWLDLVPFACTAEHHALRNLRDGIAVPQTATVGNPDSEWLGAYIRADAWGYAAPGLPEVAAEWAWRDCCISHTRNGLYGAMYFAAVISAALATGDIKRSLRLGLNEIPENCRLAVAIREALDWCHELNDYQKVLDRIFDRWQGMHVGHTLNNAALVVAGLELCRDDFETAITEVTMAGMDTDCNAATAGSIAGAVWGFSKLPSKWTEPLGSVHRSYLNGMYVWDNRDIARRFTRIALG